jgi:DNA primase
MDVKDEIRARLPIDQLVGQYCQLKKKGRNFVALCPFHNDTHPSFLVSPDKGIAYCFACQSGGDIFSFVQKIESVDFPEALKILAEKAGVELPKEPRHREGISKDEKTRLRECLDAAQAFYVARLTATADARGYVEKRGVPPALMEQFGIGYAPDSFSDTYEHLLRLGFSRSEVVASGLGVQRELKEERIYDRFRHRIMFPITDAQGQIVGFGGRAMGDSDAKYVNSPEGPLYDKSSILFGLYHARDAIRSSRRVVLVEGYFDAIAAHKAGVKNVVAVSGTALTERHVQILKRYADEVVLCLDQDNAGQLAAGRAFDLLCKAKLSIFSVTLPAKDPDELVQRDSALFSTIIATRAIPYVDAMIETLKTMPDVGEPSGKRAIADLLFPLLAALPSSIELRAYISKSATSFGIVESEFLADFRRFQAGQMGPKPKEERQLKEHLFDRFELVLGLAALYPVARPVLQELIPFDDPQWEAVRIAIANAPPKQEVSEFLASLQLQASLVERLRVIVLYCEETFPHWSETLAQKELHKLCMAVNRDRTVEKQLKIIADLKEAKRLGKTDEEQQLLTQYMKLLKLGKMASPSQQP